MARIRTIKPEFWAHPVMGRQSDAVRCMALALLNLADDEGYFYATPSVVRSFARPFDDDSTMTRRCLDDLSRIGYVSVSQSACHGPIGKIVSFVDHQRIDRPKPSEIKKLIIDDESTMNRRTFDDESTLERKGKEGKGAEGVAATNPVENSATPDGLDASQYALNAIEKLCLVWDRSLANVVAQSISILSKTEAIPLHQAHDALVARAMADVQSGVALNRFWFTDRKFLKTQPGAKKVYQSVAERNAELAAGCVQ